MTVTGCKSCLKLNTPEDPVTKVCGNCKTVLYCSTTCQRNDWKYHKTHCKSGGEVDKSDQGFKDSDGNFYFQDRVLPAGTFITASLPPLTPNVRGVIYVMELSDEMLEMTKGMTDAESERFRERFALALRFGGSQALEDERWLEWVLKGDGERGVAEGQKGEDVVREETRRALEAL